MIHRYPNCACGWTACPAQIGTNSSFGSITLYEAEDETTRQRGVIFPKVRPRQEPAPAWVRRGRKRS